MYFDIFPKQRLQDFFNYRKEYRAVKEGLEKGIPIIAIIGVRRTGKTSLMSVLFHEGKGPRVWIDGRMVKRPKEEIPAAVARAVRANQPLVFGRIESLTVSLMGMEVTLGVEQAPVEEVIGNRRVVVFIDEAQRMDTQALAELLSYFYDRHPAVQFVLSGSEVGLMEEVLGGDAATHPLYGRVVLKVEMGRLPREKSLEFLQEGFRQVGVRVRREEMEEAVDRLDGLIGWLTMYGYERAVLRKRHALKETEERAVAIVMAELAHFLKRRRNKRLYLTILKYARQGIEWSELKAAVEAELKAPLNPNSLSFALEELMRYGFLERQGHTYSLADPLLFKAAVRLSSLP